MAVRGALLHVLFFFSFSYMSSPSDSLHKGCAIQLSIFFLHILFFNKYIQPLPSQWVAQKKKKLPIFSCKVHCVEENGRSIVEWGKERTTFRLKRISKSYFVGGLTGFNFALFSPANGWRWCIMIGLFSRNWKGILLMDIHRPDKCDECIKMRGPHRPQTLLQI